jgi:hypothetical protein
MAPGLSFSWISLMSPCLYYYAIVTVLLVVYYTYISEPGFKYQIVKQSFKVILLDQDCITKTGLFYQHLELEGIHSRWSTQSGRGSGFVFSKVYLQNDSVQVPFQNFHAQYLELLV